MFSNSIKRLSESLAQAQEQARQQRQRSQQRSPDSTSIFEADKEETSIINGDDPDPNQSAEDTNKLSEETKNVSKLETKDTSLSKEVRIKLAKLAKYEDRHPKLQAAYKESQAKINTFEKVLRERTPLGSIDQIDDFRNYLNNLSTRTNMSLEELKRVTEAHDILKTQLDGLRQKQKQEHESQENIIDQLRKKVHQLEEENAQKSDLTQKAQSIENELKEKQRALEEAQTIQTSLKEETAKLRRQLKTIEAQLAEATSTTETIEELRGSKDALTLSLASLQKTLDDAIKARGLAERALQNEKAAMEKRIFEIEEQKRQIEAQFTTATKPLSLQMPGLSSEIEKLQDDVVPVSPTLTPQESSTAANKKKKKKKKKGGAVATIVSTYEETEEGPVQQETEVFKDSYPRRLLEEYLAEIKKSLSNGHLDEVASASCQLTDGTPLWNESIARGMRPSQLEGLKTTADNLLNDAKMLNKVEHLEAKLSMFASKMTILTRQLEEANTMRTNLKDQLRTAENDLQRVRAHEQQLLEKNQRLESTSEDVEQLRDMLRDVGSDLVEAKDRIKDIEKKEATAQLAKSELETTVSRLTVELNERREAARSVDDVRSQLSLSESCAESRLNELNEAKEKLISVELELVSLKTELAKVSADKNDLTVKLADAQIKLRQLERSEKEFRDRVAVIQSNLTSKEKEVINVRAELTNIQNLKAQLEEDLRSAKQELSRTGNERNELQQKEQKMREESTRYKREIELYRDKIASLESLRISLTNDRDALTEEVNMKTIQLESAQTFMQNLREQTTEMGHRAREAKERCEALEEELSEAHKLLSDRAREAGTMRRLLDAAEGREAGRIKEAREKLEAAIEERDHLEEEITLLRRNNAEGSGELIRALREKESAVNDLTTKYQVVQKDMDDMVARNKDVGAKLEKARKEADEAISKFNNLSKSLEETTAQAQQLQQERSALKEAAEESQIRVDQLQRTQRFLSEELKRLKAAEKKAPPPPSPRDAKTSLIELRSSGAQTPRDSMSSNGTDPSKAAIDKEYLRNVLVQFFEHKDKRVQLLPVLSMLLNFSKADEMKLLR